MIQMDTSMDDLFSDLEKSAHPTNQESDDTKLKVDAFTVTESVLNERLYVTIWRSEQYENAIVYEVKLSGEMDSEPPTVELLVADHQSYTQSPVKWPIVRPCVLSDSPNRSSLSRSTAIHFFNVSTRLMRAIGRVPANSVTPKCVWLLGLANGWLYAFSRTVTPVSNLVTMHYAPLCAFPTPEPVTHWNLLEDPIVSNTQTVSDGYQPVNHVLFAFHALGSGLALWLPNNPEQDLEADLLRYTQFILPVAPSPIRHTQVHGSWIHMITDSGHLLSLHCSVTASDDLPRIVDIVCQPANFPRLPSVFRSLTASSELAQPTWRYFALVEFVRLAVFFIHVFLQKAQHPPPDFLPEAAQADNSLSIAPTTDQACLLLRSSENNPLCMFGRAPLDIALHICPVYDLDTEDTVAHVDGPTQWSLVEPWFTESPPEPYLPSKPSTNNRTSGISLRRLTIPVTQLIELYTRVSDNRVPTGNLIGLRVCANLIVRAPSIPSPIINLFDCSLRPYRMVAPCLPITLGSVLLDSVHWLCPIQINCPAPFSPFGNAPRWTRVPKPTISFRLESCQQLHHVLQDLFNSFTDREGHHSGSIPTTAVLNVPERRGSVRLSFMLTGQPILIEWWHHEPGDLDENAVEGTGSAHIRMTASCVRTLWCVGKSVERIVRTRAVSSSVSSVSVSY
ncbi:unnamed protein product [Echinostoma caproni]|uniref:Nucleoporin_N domain-containing protein n=1 Tax=Echinostoma caproni TaxID=27848 RepID=A0A183ADW3_9TREM|nr:unnamed protein product [Echinostoma caproni]